MLTQPKSSDNTLPVALRASGFLNSWPTIGQTWMGIALSLVVLGVLLTPIPPHDFWWHLAVGRQVVESGHIPRLDSNSWTQAGQPFYNQGWLAELLMYGLYQFGGPALLILVQAVVVGGAYAILLMLLKRRAGIDGLAGQLLLLAILMSADNWNVRPQTYCLPIFATYVYVLFLWRERKAPQQAPLWLLPLLMALWVNLHGSFLLGGVLLALTFLGDLLDHVAPSPTRAATGDEPLFDLLAEEPLVSARRLKFLGWSILTAWAMLLNPRGIHVLGYVLHLLRTPAVANLVTEWAPPTYTETTGLAFFAFCLLLVLLQIAQFRIRCWPTWAEALPLLLLLWMGGHAGRNVIWLAFFATPLLAEQIAAWKRWRTADKPVTTSPDHPPVNAGILGVFLLLMVLFLPWIKPALPLPASLGALCSPQTPIALVDQLQTFPDKPHRLFNAMSYGSYLIWAAPDIRVFIDPRIELYPYAQWLDYMALNAGERVDELVKKYRFDAMLLRIEEQAALLKEMKKRPDWTMRLKNDSSGSVYLVRPVP